MRSEAEIRVMLEACKLMVGVTMLSPQCPNYSVGVAMSMEDVLKWVLGERSQDLERMVAAIEDLGDEATNFVRIEGGKITWQPPSWLPSLSD